MAAKYTYEQRGNSPARRYFRDGKPIKASELPAMAYVQMGLPLPKRFQTAETEERAEKARKRRDVKRMLRTEYWGALWGA